MPPTESRVKINGFAALDIAADRCSQTIKRSVAAPSPDYRRTTSFYQKRICEKYLTVPGYVMNPQTPTKQFDHFLKRHGIRHLKFHGLRHTSATMLLANGCDIKTVSSRLGHADIGTTNIYVHALESTDRMAAQTFDNLLKRK